MSGAPMPEFFKQLIQQIENADLPDNPEAHFIDVIPACNRYENNTQPVWELDGIGDTYADRLCKAGIPNTHVLADTSTEELADITSAGETQAEQWVSQVEEATLHDNDDVWMTVMVIPGGGDIDNIMAFIDNTTGINAPFDGHTVRFYMTSNLPEIEAEETNPDALHSKEIDVITDGIRKHFDTPISETPYAALTQNTNQQHKH